MGTPDLAAHILEKLLDHGYDVVGVVTQQDKPQGRHAAAEASPVKKVAIQRLDSSTIFQPERARDSSFIESIKALQPDLMVVAAYGQILPQALLNIPTLGCINVHYSLLPKLRGAAPIQRAILEGYSKTGVTIMRMVLQMDAGAILSQQQIALDDNITSGELREKLTQISSPLLVKTLHELENGRIVGIEQDVNDVTFAPKINPEDAHIDWKKPAIELQRLIRAMDPEPGAWCYARVRGQRRRLKFFQPQIVLPQPSSSIVAGTILSLDKALVVATGAGNLNIAYIQPDGKSKMSIKSFSAGCKLIDIIFE